MSGNAVKPQFGSVPAPPICSMKLTRWRDSAFVPWTCEKIESERSGSIAALNPQAKTRAERTFHPGGAGAPAHAWCRKCSIFNFFAAPRGTVAAGDRGSCFFLSAGTE